LFVVYIELKKPKFEEGKRMAVDSTEVMMNDEKLA